MCIVALMAACASVEPAPVAIGTPSPALRPEPSAPLADRAPLAESPGRVEAPDSPAPAARSLDGSFDAYLAGLRDASCPDGIEPVSPAAVALAAKPVPLQALNPSRRTIGELTFVAGFHLTSADRRFGGLSGLEMLDDGNLLAVSDQGDFVWIDLGEDGVTPATVRIASMLDAGGEPLRGKADGDAEGLAVTEGMALVSFERNHRILAFDLRRCGAAARGAAVVTGVHGRPLPAAFESAKIVADGNEGPEPLAITPDWRLFTGIETKVGDASPLSARPIEAAPEFDLRLGEGAAPFVGLDVTSSDEEAGTVRAFSLHRSFSPLSGNAISVRETTFERYREPGRLPSGIVSEIDERSRYRFRRQGARTLAQMNVLLTIDNFEGVAAKEMQDGRVRLYLISDDNFSSSQRTLLMVFDVSRE